jgi:large subunit ribosomal protein L9
MKVVLSQDVRGTGKKGQLVEVSDGFARNFLLPKKLATEASAQSINAAQKQREAEAHRVEVEREQAKQIAKELNGQVFELKAKAGEGGRLFGAITSREIGDAVVAKYPSIELDKKRIELDENIKRLGTYEVEIRPYANVTCKIVIHVIPQ